MENHEPFQEIAHPHLNSKQKLTIFFVLFFGFITPVVFGIYFLSNPFKRIRTPFPVPVNTLNRTS
ncbi:MAG: hypothetical protein WCO06_06110 [Candidatus Roizmanbacteria bacterium]